jgi:hypothetical protein
MTIVEFRVDLSSKRADYAAEQAGRIGLLGLFLEEVLAIDTHRNRLYVPSFYEVIRQDRRSPEIENVLIDNRTEGECILRTHLLCRLQLPHK